MSWRTFFPHDEPYGPQASAIETAHEVVRKGGYFAFEGPCGTGKTLAALAPIASIIKEAESPFERCVTATHNKQQTKQFAAECREINAGLATRGRQLRSLVLVGKEDLHPYLREDLLEEESIDEGLQKIRERTAEVVKKDSEVALNTDPNRLRSDPANLWYSVERARVAFENAKGLVTIQQREAPLEEVDREDLPSEHEIIPAETRDDDRAYIQWEVRTSLETAGYESPLPDRIVRVEDIVDGDPDALPEDLRGPIDPFYIGVFAQAGQVPFGFDAGKHHVLEADDLLREAIPQGLHPHECMAILGQRADVIICNYNHFIHPQVRLLTDMKMGLLDEQTLLVVDEAHNLEERARSTFGESVGLATLRTAKNDLKGAMNFVEHGTRQDSDSEEKLEVDLVVKERAQDQLNDYEDVDFDHLLAFERLLDRLQDSILEKWITEQFDEWNQDWEAALALGEVPDEFPEETSWSLDRENRPDQLTTALEADYDTFVDEIWPAVEPPSFEEFVALLPQIASACDAIWQGTFPGRELKAHTIARLLNRWILATGSTYYRELSLELSNYDEPQEWHRVYNLELELTNCIPADDLAKIFDTLGGGVLMSATLEPLDVFADVTGLSILAEERGRTVVTDSYNSLFPEENRALLTQDLPAYTSDKRGERTLNEEEITSARHQYGAELAGIASAYGNVLIGMPSYDEAEWLVEYLRSRSHVNKRVLQDEPSTNAETNALLERFDAGPPKVLVTSLRGTVTEGVDYPGDKLHTAVVVGVPIASLGNDLLKAVEKAYADRFGESNAFDYTYTIPAVRKARQCIGRVIRSSTDVGVQIFLDSRYLPDGYRSVNVHLSEQERDELNCVSSVSDSISLFWEMHDGL